MNYRHVDRPAAICLRDAQTTDRYPLAYASEPPPAAYSALSLAGVHCAGQGISKRPSRVTYADRATLPEVIAASYRARCSMGRASPAASPARAMYRTRPTSDVPHHHSRAL